MLPQMPAMKTQNVNSDGGALATLTCMSVDIKPTLSARPIPNITTRISPSGGKFTKLLTTLVSMNSTPSADSRLRTTTSSPVWGLMAETPSTDSRAETTTTRAASTVNRIKGCGSLLPTRSMEVRTPCMIES